MAYRTDSRGWALGFISWLSNLTAVQVQTNEATSLGLVFLIRKAGIASPLEFLGVIWILYRNMHSAQCIARPQKCWLLLSWLLWFSHLRTLYYPHWFRKHRGAPWLLPLSIAEYMGRESIKFFQIKNNTELNPLLSHQNQSSELVIHFDTN